MSIKIMSHVFETRGMTSAEKLVALALADHAHDDGTEARPGQTRLADKTELSEQTVRRALKGLLAKNVIAVQRRATPSTPVCYQFLLGGAKLAPGTKSDVGGATLIGGGCHGGTLTINEPSEDKTSLSVVVNDDRRGESFSTATHELCEHLARCIERNGSKRPTVTQRWLADMDKLERIDGRRPGQIQRMIDWCQADSFWRANIQSPTKLRAKYDQMRLRAMAELEENSGTNTMKETERLEKIKADEVEFQKRQREVHEKSVPMPEFMKKRNRLPRKAT